MLIKNGILVTKSGQKKGDLRISGQHMEVLAKSLPPRQGEAVIDAADKYVLPGGMDVHAHMALNTEVAVATDDFFTGTIASACGGATTIVDHIAFAPVGSCAHLKKQSANNIIYKKSLISLSAPSPVVERQLY